MIQKPDKIDIGMLEYGVRTPEGVFRCFTLLSLSFMVATALSVGPVVVAGSDNDSSNEASFTEITECTKIVEPGEYVLANDIEGAENSPCIEIIETESVVFDGRGYSIRNAGVGVFIRDSSNIVVENLYVERTERNGIGIWNSEAIEIHGNTISNTGSGQGWRNNSIHSWKSTEIEIYNNTVINSSNYGIYAGRTSDANIYENTVINAHWSIFTAESKNIVIDENKVKNPDTDGNAIAGTHIINVTVTNNYINQSVYGIEAKPNSTDVVIRDNVIRNTVLCSIEAEGHDPDESSYPGKVSDVVIENNVMESTGPLGVWVNTSEIIVRNNTVKNAHGLGMYVNGIDGNVEIYGNRFINSTSAAIRVNNTEGYLQIYENDFRQLDTGLRLLNSADIRIEQNRFSEVQRLFEERNTSGIEVRNNTDGKGDTPTPPFVQESTRTPGQLGFDLMAAMAALLFTIVFAWIRKRVDQ